MILAVIDTNVLVSALYTSNPQSATRLVIAALGEHKYVPLYNEAILKEYREVLCRPKFGFAPDMVDALLRLICENGQNVDRVSYAEKMKDETDRKFFEVALAKQDEDAKLVTGNQRHFPVKPFVVTPTEFYNLLTQS